ncbi:MAG: type I glutamate--ammonia ligase [Anaerolineales bacterium]|nr:type I glutamate--ammonia ligase [Anaerolineales bacterium]MCB9127062.1 type I glutamate--ammonia ligase [Ardenticatenales bacterium]MCB9172413.1 type I glutamate--ammonia ligase [Ardenticatenales bacterium]
MTFEEIQTIIDDENIRYVNLQFTDIVGMVKNQTIPISQFAEAVDHGVWFDGSSVEGFARIAESDMYLMPDLETFSIIPWDRGAETTTARVICDVFTPDGDPFPGDPRYVLRRAVAEAEAMGVDYMTGPEPEFFLFERDEQGNPRPLPHDNAGYFDVSTDLGTVIRRHMVNAIENMGIEVEALHHEVAAGQHEIDFRYGDALRTADNVVTLRIAVKAIAEQLGLYATFMPKPIAGINGSGMHVHQSLLDRESGANLFSDPDAEYGLSEMALQFIAGLLDHAPGLAAIVAPTVNSYKRLVPGYEAPVYISWARTNRSALIRVPRINPHRPQATRVELRCPDPSANPYLAFTVMLAAGLDGIRRKLTPPTPAEEDLYHLTPERLAERQLQTLPGSLGEALEALKANTLVQEALGPHIYERFFEAKQQEWDSYRLHVSAWEHDRYLRIF